MEDACPMHRRNVLGISLGLSLLGSGSFENVGALIAESEDLCVRRGCAGALGLVFSGTKTGGSHQTVDKR